MISLRLVFRSIKGRWHGNNQFLLLFFWQNWFAGRRRLVAQPGGLTVGFDLHLVVFYRREVMPQRGIIYRPLSVCLSVRLSVTSLCWVLYWNGWVDLVGFLHGGFLRPILHLAARRFVISRNMGTSVWYSTLSLNSGLENFDTACRSSQGAVNSAGDWRPSLVGRTKLTILTTDGVG